ncbi:unknown [Bacteroides intestinalis CAG:315]|jgi:hypothetical protein|nr:unknown [Bacteroides intestinalis CAG:315]
MKEVLYEKKTTFDTKNKILWNKNIFAYRKKS